MQPIIYQVALLGDGFLATMARPRASEWAEDEFAALANLGINRIISLLEPHESAELGLLDEAEYCKSAEIAFVSYPIPDRGVPSDMTSLLKLSQDTYERCSGGENTAIHCRAGIGRSSLIAAAVMLQHGHNVNDAFLAIEQARGVQVPDTPEQRHWLLQYHRTVLEGGCA